MALGEIEVLFLTLLLGLLVLAVVAARRRRWDAAGWAERLGLDLSPRATPPVQAYLDRARRGRLVGAVAGLLTPMVGNAVLGEPLPPPLDFGLLDALVGYSLGALLAEASVGRPRAGERPAASLLPREVRDYLAPWRLRLLRGGAVAALTLVALVPVLYAGEESADVPPAPVIATTVVVLWAAVEAALRGVVRRRRGTVEPDLVAADDAIRSSSLHALAAAGASLQLLIASVHLMVVGAADALTPELGTAVQAVAVAVFVGAQAVWAVFTRPPSVPARRRVPA